MCNMIKSLSSSNSSQKLSPTLKLTLISLPEDILYMIIQELDFLSTLTLRRTCRLLYNLFPDSTLFVRLTFTISLTQCLFERLFDHITMIDSEKTSYIRKVDFRCSKINT